MKKARNPNKERRLITCILNAVYVMIRVFQLREKSQ